MDQLIIFSFFIHLGDGGFFFEFEFLILRNHLYVMDRYAVRLEVSRLVLFLDILIKIRNL